MAPPDGIRPGWDEDATRLLPRPPDLLPVLDPPGTRTRPAPGRPAAQRDTFAILMVCSGNICRSPMAQRLAEARLGHWLGAAASEFTVASAGTMALVGEPMHRYAARSLAEYGVREGRFRARQLDGPLITRADLVLCAAREHQEAVLLEEPAALRRTFTLRQFRRVAESLRPQELDSSGPRAAMSSLVALAATRRGRTPTVGPAADDLADPYGGPPEAFRECAARIHRYLNAPICLAAEAVDGRRRDAGRSAGPRHR